jgi:hypothetical protein
LARAALCAEAVANRPAARTAAVVVAARFSRRRVDTGIILADEKSNKGRLKGEKISRNSGLTFARRRRFPMATHSDMRQDNRIFRFDRIEDRLNYVALDVCLRCRDELNSAILSILPIL